MIIIIDADLGNLKNVEKAFLKLGYSVKISSKISEIKKAKALVFPGVGAFGKAMGNIKKFGLQELIKKRIEEGTPFLGICLGMQVLFEKSEESKKVKGLEVLKGVVKKFPFKKGLKVPQIGWNSLKFTGVRQPIFQGIADNEMFYFVHSYFVDPVEKEIIIGKTFYGVNFTSAIRKGNLYGFQFHPEKSGIMGLKLLDNFGKICGLN